jgi:hypothetical protein
MSIKAKEGQRVQVDLGGLEVPGVSIGPGVLGLGEIIGLDPAEGFVTVRLDNLSFGEEKESVIEAPATKVELLPEENPVTVVTADG